MAIKEESLTRRKKYLIDLYLSTDNITIKELVNLFNSKEYIDPLTEEIITLSKNTVLSYLSDEDFIIRNYSNEINELIKERKKQQKRDGNLAGGLTYRNNHHRNFNYKTEIIARVCLKYPNAKYSELAEYLKTHFNIEVSESTISRIINSKSAKQYITEKEYIEMKNIHHSRKH